MVEGFCRDPQSGFTECGRLVSRPYSGPCEKDQDHIEQGDRRADPGEDLLGAGGDGIGLFFEGLYIDNIILMEIEIRGIKDTAIPEIEAAIGAGAVLFTDEQDIFAVAVGGQIPGHTEGFENMHPFLACDVSAGSIDFSEYGKTEIDQPDMDNGVKQVGLEAPDQHSADFREGHSGDRQAAEYGKVDRPVQVDAIGGGGGHLLLVGTQCRTEAQIEGGDDLGINVVGIEHANAQHVIGLDAQGCPVEDAVGGSGKFISF